MMTGMGALSYFVDRNGWARGYRVNICIVYVNIGGKMNSSTIVINFELFTKVLPTTGLHIAISTISFTKCACLFVNFW